MNITHWARRMGALSFVTAVAVLLSGCGGSGGGSSVPAELQGVSNAAVSGELINTQTRGNSTATHFYLRFAAGSGGSITGSANFSRGVGTSDFFAYSAEIANVTRVNNQGTNQSGTLSFDLVNFTAGAPYQSMHWSGDFSWNGQTGSGSVFTVTNGAITATDSQGNAVSGLGFSFNLLANAPDTNYGGQWHGQISIEGLDPISWTGNFTRHSDVSTTAVIDVDGQDFPVTGRTTFTTFSGEFDAGLIYPLLEGDTAVFFVNSEVGSSTFEGNIIVVDQEGSVVPIVATVTGTRGAGTGATITSGYYQGTLSPSSGVVASLSMDLLQVNGTTGAYGGVSLNPTGLAIRGARIASVDSNGSTAVVHLSNFTNTYTSMTLTGTVTSNGFNGTYTAGLVAGGSENGTFASTKLSNVPHYTIGGNWEGTATGGNGQGTPNAFSGTIAQTQDEFTFAVTQNVAGNEVTFTVSGYLVGNTFVGDANDQTISVGGIPGTIDGHFEGVVAESGTTISGEFYYTASALGGTLSDNGVFTINKI